MDFLRRPVRWWWQVVAGAVIAAVVLGVLHVAALPGQFAVSQPALSLLAVVFAAGFGGLYAGLTAAVLLVVGEVGWLWPLSSAAARSLALQGVIGIAGAVLVGLLRQDLGRIGADLQANQSLLAAANVRLERAKELEAMRAYYDPTTDLPTRRLVVDRFSQMIPLARRNQTLAALVLLNLDRFGEVNAAFGLDIGDEVLRQLGQRLTAVMRRGDTVGRMEGNTFVVLLGGLTDQAGAGVAAQKLLETLRAPFEVSGRRVQLSAGLGIAQFPHEGEDWETLYRVAGEALRSSRKRLSGVRT